MKGVGRALWLAILKYRPVSVLLVGWFAFHFLSTEDATRIAVSHWVKGRASISTQAKGWIQSYEGHA